MRKITGKALENSLNLKRRAIGTMDLNEYYSFIDKISKLSQDKRSHLISVNKTKIKPRLRNDLKNQAIVIEVKS
jgi:hypothetical protein